MWEGVKHLQQTESTDWVMWLCDREPLPVSLSGPLDLRNVGRRHLAAVAPRYLADRLKIYHYVEEDMTPLAHFRVLKSLSMTWAPSVTDVAPIAKLHGLEELVLQDLPAVRDLSPLAWLAELKTSSISGGMWKLMRIDSLGWMASQKSLRVLEIFNLRLAVNDITVLGELSQLESLKVANTWPMEQFARLAARFGPSSSLLR